MKMTELEQGHYLLLCTHPNFLGMIFLYLWATHFPKLLMIPQAFAGSANGLLRKSSVSNTEYRTFAQYTAGKSPPPPTPRQISQALCMVPSI